MWPQPGGGGVVVSLCLGPQEVLAAAAGVLEGMGLTDLAGAVRGAAGGGGVVGAKRRRVEGGSEGTGNE